MVQVDSILFFKKNFWRTRVLSVGPLKPLFWTFCDVCPGFQSQGGSFAFGLPCLCTMDSSDSPLAQHLPTSWWPALQLVMFPTCYNVAEIGCRDLIGRPPAQQVDTVLHVGNHEHSAGSLGNSDSSVNSACVAMVVCEIFKKKMQEMQRKQTNFWNTKISYIEILQKNSHHFKNGSQKFSKTTTTNSQNWEFTTIQVFHINFWFNINYITVVITFLRWYLCFKCKWNV